MCGSRRYQGLPHGRGPVPRGLARFHGHAVQTAGPFPCPRADALPPPPECTLDVGKAHSASSSPLSPRHFPTNSALPAAAVQASGADP